MITIINRRKKFTFIFILLFCILIPLYILKYLSISSKDVLLENSIANKSKWKKNRLVIIPAIYNEIKWNNNSTWPFWLRQGLDLFNKNLSRSYDIYLYQRIDPNCNPPYTWPYSPNMHEEAGVYLKFIYDFYYDLPDKMLFIHAKPTQHSLQPIEASQCIRDDVYYTTINDLWIQNRPWTSKMRDPIDNQSLIYKCAKHLLNLFGFDGEAQLNPDNQQPNDHNVISAMCCAQFYVRKERIHHYTYEQWSSVYNASLQPYCTHILDREFPGRMVGVKYFGGSLEFLWHIILGLHPAYMLPPRTNTNTDLCHLFYPSCRGSLCKETYLKYYVHPHPKSFNSTSLEQTLKE
ncbi:unnamed protein product [Adineta steineri]|uniref:Uncharacterized protein n=1 Tax=Adineta steineri TaxID=433720 RepID=A0A815SVX6_9BILA|nr:unnamed protein product [Adineta steineri]CAF3901257.1 unnamed protein product [Adineta steineri]